MPEGHRDPGGLDLKAKNENVNMFLQSMQMLKNLVVYFSCECMIIKMVKSLQNDFSGLFV